MSDTVLATLPLRSQTGLAQCRTHMAQFAAQGGIARGALTRAVTAVSEVTRAALLVYGGEVVARFLTRSAADRHLLVLELQGRPLAASADLPGMPRLPEVVEAVRRLLDGASLETHQDGRQSVMLTVRLPATSSLAAPRHARIGALPRIEREDRAQALAAAHAATWLWTPATGRIHLDELGLGLLGLAPGEFAGSLQALVDCIHPSDGAAFGETLMRGDGDLCRIVRVVRSDGEIRDIAVSGGPQADGSGLGGLLVDITERLASQRAQDDRQRQKLEVIGELAGAMAHEINNLLQPVIGVAGLLREDAEEAGPLAADLDIILDSARKAASILHDVLTFARPAEAGQATVSRLTVAVQESLRFLRSLLPPSIHLEVTLPEDDAADTVMLGDTAIQQILTNLVTNASQAMNQTGTVAITVASAVLSDDVAATLEVPPGDYVLLSVRDTGRGMDRATQSMMFEPFFTTKPVGQGTGLGLSVVFGIVRNMGGALSVESAPGAGSTISVYLPMAARTQSNRVNMTEARPVEGSQGNTDEHGFRLRRNWDEHGFPP